VVALFASSASKNSGELRLSHVPGGKRFTSGKRDV
jgi:hypothetical protein